MTTETLWARAERGETIDGPRRTVTEALIETLVGAGGYTHPLFTDADHALASGFAARPLPGQGLLLVLGGLAEQSGVFDDSVVAVLGFDDVAFRRPVLAGTTVALRIELLDATPTSRPGRGIVRARWTALDGAAELATATVRMLVAT